MGESIEYKTETKKAVKVFKTSNKTKEANAKHAVKPSPVQMGYLKRGLNQAGGKLPLFNEAGQLYSQQTIKACIVNGWAEPWFSNPAKPDWLVCKLTEQGRKALA